MDLNFSILEELKNVKQELKTLNGYGKVFEYTSDVTTLSYSVTTENAALASPVISFQTPNQEMKLDTLAFGWDTNAFTYYKYKWSLDGVDQFNSNFNKMATFANSINIFSGNKIPVPASANFNLYAYNYNSGTSSNQGNMQVYMLGYLI